MKFSKPSKIQEKALPLLLADPPQNLIAQSQSGTGKTAAFVLAMLTRVDASKPYPQILCLSPTFDLAQQTGKVLQQMAQYFPEIKMKYAVRGSRVFQHRLSNEKVTEHILIGTAGTTLDWAVKYRVFDPKLINMFVLDEGDVMIDTQGQQDQTIRLHRLLRTDCQNVLFSATYSEEVMSFANKIISDPNIIRLRRSEESLDNIKQYYVWCTAGDEGKYTALTNIYGVLTIGQCIVFCRTRKSAIWLAGKMNKDGHAVALLTGQSNVEQRIAVLNRFREGSERLLITTNLCARGIDIDQVTLVVNYDIPVDVNHEPDCETYLHRIGRSGRFGKSGLAINFVDSQKAYDNLMSIQNHFKRVISELDTDDPDEIEKLQN
ncbi:PREDICTED: ATP-dependent RNA helicase DDX19A-like [Amphimedon queenslandica]|nr:PREDICTED: ATP-dependent RNA helicase DDX19A-like [Amphimedon queenslandica]|eukprot:XP_011406688.1 PREDICTED: ATP-dependent RNA helicase DDX19A-like [Amphimedon queenslandica]